MNPSEDSGQPELTISGLTCARTEDTISLSMTLTNLLDESIVLYEVQVYAPLPHGDSGPGQDENVGVELGIGETYDGTFRAYKAAGLPDENTYYVDTIYGDEQGEAFVEQHTVNVALNTDGELSASLPKFIERYVL